MHSPLEQFEVFHLNSLSKFSLVTNFSLVVLFLTLVVCLTFYLVVRVNYMALNRWQGFLELYYSYILKILMENAGRRSQPYFPFVLTLFTFILMANLLGMFPLGYAVTSQVLITFTLSCTVFLGSIFIGLRKHQMNFFSLFFPTGSPTSLAPLLVPIELLSFISRPFSLGIRLFANMLAGHVLLKIMAGFAFVSLMFASGGEFVNLGYLIKSSYVWTVSTLGKDIPPIIKLGLLGDYIELLNFRFDKNTIQFIWEQVADEARKDYEKKKEEFYFIRDILAYHIPQLADFIRSIEYPSFNIVEIKEKFDEEGKLFEMNPIGHINPKIKFFNFQGISWILDYLIRILLVILPLGLLNAFIILELGIAFLQAYVFVILATIYVGDALSLH